MNNPWHTASYNILEHHAHVHVVRLSEELNHSYDFLVARIVIYMYTYTGGLILQNRWKIGIN